MLSDTGGAKQSTTRLAGKSPGYAMAGFYLKSSTCSLPSQRPQRFGWKPNGYFVADVEPDVRRQGGP